MQSFKFLRQRNISIASSHMEALSPPSSSWGQAKPSQTHLAGFYSLICGLVTYLVSHSLDECVTKWMPQIHILTESLNFFPYPHLQRFQSQNTLWDCQHCFSVTRACVWRASLFAAIKCSSDIHMCCGYPITKTYWTMKRFKFSEPLSSCHHHFSNNSSPTPLHGWVDPNLIGFLGEHWKGTPRVRLQGYKPKADKYFPQCWVHWEKEEKTAAAFVSLTLCLLFILDNHTHAIRA